MNDEMTPEEAKAIAAYNAAKLQLQKGVPGDRGSEGLFGAAYQKLVNLGLRPQIRKKYR